MPITQKDREWEAEHHRRLMIAEADADRAYRKNLQVIKDRRDLWGDDALSSNDKELVKKHKDFFDPEEG